MQFAIYSSTAAVTLQQITDIAEACTIQLNLNVQAYCETGAASKVTAFADVGSVPDVDIHFEVAPSIAEAPGAIAYHSTNALGRPMCKVGWDVCLQVAGGDVAKALVVLQTAISHECVEAQCDPYCLYYADWPADATKKVCLEYCDPVEGDSYPIQVMSGATVMVSNFVTDRWFSDGPGPYDFLGKLTAPRTMSPGGYLAFDDGSQVYGDQMPQWKRDQKAKYGRRA